MKTPSPANRLTKEKSPYLLQHAHNPVDWYPWGPEAFERAKRENKPIFLSIGYSTCHWCHVMAHESFENDSVAEVLNRDFVSIKVDREERPDIDQIYMAAVTQAMQQQGGWPLSVWLTPDLKPFAGGTYFPPEDKFGRKGFKRVLQELTALWKARHEDLLRSAESISSFLIEVGAATAPGKPGIDLVTGALRSFERIFDDENGGFGHAPKFPQPPLALFLLRLHARTGEKRPLEMVEAQLRHMADGGIYDHLGGGFARYSTDERWHVPHFEKMLYDNAQLLRLYAEAFRLTKNPRYKTIARETADYVLHDMTDKEGGFHSAEDADSEGVEGKFYVWTRPELDDLLGERDARLFAYAYDVTKEGNWSDPHFDTNGLNVIWRKLDDEQVAKLEKIPVLEVRTSLTTSRRKLFEARSKRVRPGLDDKVLTSWNGLMIGALAYAGSTFDEPRYLSAALRAASFVSSTLTSKGRLLHRYRAGEAGLDGLLEDYAFFVSGLLDLHESTLDEKWLRLARDLNATCIQDFYDEEKGGFFLASQGRSDLIARSKDIHDGALPSASNVALFNLVRLAEITSDPTLRARVEKSIAAYAGAIAEQPAAFPLLLSALDWLLGPSRQIVLAGDPQPMLRVLNAKFLPRTVLVRAESDPKLVPMVEGKAAKEGKPTAYVCENYSCQLPLTDPAALEQMLQPSR